MPSPLASWLNRDLFDFAVGTAGDTLRDLTQSFTPPAAPKPDMNSFYEGFSTKPPVPQSVEMPDSWNNVAFPSVGQSDGGSWSKPKPTPTMGDPFAYLSRSFADMGSKALQRLRGGDPQAAAAMGSAPVATQDPTKLLEHARAELGKPYTGPIAGMAANTRFGDPGWDCSSFVAGVYQKMGVKLTPFTDTAARETQLVANDQAQPGDIIFFKYNDPSQPGVRYPHMGIYIGNGQMIDASFGRGVTQRAILNMPYEIRRPGAGRVAAPPVAAGTAVGADGYRAMAWAEAQRVGIDPDIFERQINQESGFQLGRVSPAGARGIAQIVPRWHPNVNPDDPAEALRYAADLMAANMKKYGGDIRLALAAYNAGPGAVGMYGGVPPYAETQRYLRAILGS